MRKYLDERIGKTEADFNVEYYFDGKLQKFVPHLGVVNELDLVYDSPQLDTVYNSKISKEQKSVRKSLKEAKCAPSKVPKLTNPNSTNKSILKSHSSNHESSAKITTWISSK